MSLSGSTRELTNDIHQTTYLQLLSECYTGIFTPSYIKLAVHNLGMSTTEIEQYCKLAIEVASLENVS